MMILNTNRNQKLLFYFSLWIFGLIHLAIVIWNHYQFKTFAFDYGVYNFAFYDYAHLKISPCPVYLAGYDITFLQDHFSLTLIFLSPFYWVLTPVFGTYSLLIIQYIFIIWGAWATYQLIFIKSQKQLLALMSLLFYFLLYGRYSAYHSDCNLVVMGSALVPVFLYYFEKKKIVPTYLLFAFLILNREDFSLNLFFLCLMLLIIYREDKLQKRFALFLSILSLIGFIFIFTCVIPALEDKNKSFSLFSYNALGENPLEALYFIISHPLDAISYLFTNHTSDVSNDWIKTKFYLVYLISGGIILFLRPIYLIPLIPLIAKKMYNDESFRWSYESYYGTEIATILPILVFLVIAELKHSALKIILGSIVVVLSLGVTLVCMSRSTAYYYGFNKFDVFSNSFYHTNLDIEIINSMTSKIPDNAVVSASNRILPHLAARNKIFYFPQINEADFVCITTLEGSYPATQEAFDKRVNELRTDENWKILEDKNGCLLFEKIK